jgi:hypothetical protein
LVRGSCTDHRAASPIRNPFINSRYGDSNLQTGIATHHFLEIFNRFLIMTIMSLNFRLSRPWDAPIANLARNRGTMLYIREIPAIPPIAGLFVLIYFSFDVCLVDIMPKPTNMATLPNDRHSQEEV